MPLESPYLDAIKTFEGFTPRASWDYKQHSIGYGTKARFPGETIDQAEADRRFQSEIGSARDTVRKLGIPLDPGREAALTSLTFNAGPGWMNDGLGQAVRAGNWDEAARRFAQYNKAGGQTLPGLADRRNQELAWMTGQAPQQGGGLSAAQPMMLGGPKDTGAQPMALSDPREQGFSLENWTTSPLFQMGAGVLGAPNIGQGLMQGSQAAAGFASARQKQQKEAELFPLQKQLMQAQIQKANEPASSDDIREFQFAKRDGYAGGFSDWMKQKREMNGQTAQQVTWGTDAQGNYVAMQASRDGKLVQSQLPQGVVPVPAEVLAYRKTQANQQGEASGKAKANLPVVEAQSKLMLDAIGAVENDPYLPNMTGFMANYRPNVTKEAVASQARIDQVQGKAFLQAFEGLRGGGAITEAEGAKATASISRLQAMAVGTEEYKRALNDVRKEVTSLVELARRKAAAPEPSATVRPSQPQQGGTQPQGPVDLGNGVRILRRLD